MRQMNWFGLREGADVEKDPTTQGADSIFWILFPACGCGDHDHCEAMQPRIGDETSQARWLGYQHCRCKCHKFVMNKTSWSVERSDAYKATFRQPDKEKKCPAASTAVPSPEPPAK